jgi:hypothetical protein
MLVKVVGQHLKAVAMAMAAMAMVVLVVRKEA